LVILALRLERTYPTIPKWQKTVKSNIIVVFTSSLESTHQ
jgi:hypothetical protein